MSEQLFFIVGYAIIAWAIAFVVGVPLSFILFIPVEKFLMILNKLSSPNATPESINWVKLFFTYTFTGWELLWRFNPLRVSLAFLSIGLMFLSKITKTLVTFNSTDVISGIVFYVADFEHGSNEIMNNSHKTYMATLETTKRDYQQNISKMQKELDAFRISYKRLSSIIFTAKERSYDVDDIVFDARRETERFNRIVNEFKANPKGTGEAKTSQKASQPINATQTGVFAEGDATLDLA